MASIGAGTSILSDALVMLEKKEQDLHWDNAMKDIKVFIEHYIPKEIFDLNKSPPQQIGILDDINNGYRNFIIRAPRKGGKTILVAIIVVWLCLKNAGYRWFVLSGSLEQAKWLYRYCKRFVTDNPKIKEQLLHDPTQILTEFKNGSFIICAPASFKAVNAPTVDGLVMDEYVLIDPEIIVDAWPMIRASSYPMRLILSTATDKVSLDSFLDISERALELGFRPYFWDDSQCPWLSEEDSKLAKAVLTPEDYRTRYGGGIPLKRSAVFRVAEVSKAFKKLEKLPEDYFDVVKGPIKVGIDWGFTHDTCFLAGWLGLDYTLNIFKCMVTSEIDDEELAETALSWDLEFFDKYGRRCDGWYADSAGAFQNAMMRKKGLWVEPRVFGRVDTGKEWMIRTANWFLEKEKVNIPDTYEFEVFKKQMKSYRRDKSGKPKKGNDHGVDTFLCLASGWDPTNSVQGPKVKRVPRELDTSELWERADWKSMRVTNQAWRPDNWRKKSKWPWEK